MGKIIDAIKEFFIFIYDSIRSFFSSLLDYITDFWKWLVSIYEYITSACADIVRYLWDQLCDLWEAVWGPIDTWLLSLFDSVIEVIPDFSSLLSTYSDFSLYLSYVNSWIAFDVLFYCLLTYFVFLAAMIPIKLIWKLFIPTVG